MPSCVNACNAYYKGTEPSPKGRGYCARGECVGTKKRGKDKKMWIVKAYKVKGKKVKRWVHVSSLPKKKEVI